MHITLNDTAYISNLFQRDFFSIDERKTGWDLCMENSTCKALSITGIVIGCLSMIWFTIALCLVCFLGISCFNAMFCGGFGNFNRSQQQQQFHQGNYYPHNSPMNMYTPSHDLTQPQIPGQVIPGQAAPVQLNQPA